MRREETQSRGTGSTSASALSISNPHEQITHLSVSIQASAELTPAVPAWFGEVVLVATYLKKQGVLMKLCEQVRFARKRFGRYEVVDFLVVLFGYAISGERTDGGSSTRASSRSPFRLWPCLNATDCLLVRPFRGF